jgi:peptidoglycan/LPS O-acetylase OafA/YrhL
MRHEKRLDIQGLRAIAVTAVVCFHAGLSLPGGFTGVDVFFVISGFVITLTLLREWQGTGRIDLTNFYIRRFKRLAPALSFMVAVTMVLSFLLLSPLGSQVRAAGLTGIGAILMSANGAIATQTGGYFQIAAADNPLLNTWSLSVEEQFYILFPSVLFLALITKRRFKAGEYAALIAIVAIGFISTVAVARSMRGGGPPANDLLLGFYSPVTRAWEFAAGAILALVEPATPRHRFIATAATSVGAVLLGVSFLFITNKAVFPGPLTLLPIVSSMALIWGGAGSSGLLSRTLESKPFVYIGDISYSWYLWHWPLIVFASAAFEADTRISVLTALLSLLPAIASYHLLEQPLRRYRPPTRRKALQMVYLTALPTLAICLLLVFTNANGYWSPEIANYQASVDRLHAGKEAGCGDGYVPNSQADRKCDFNTGAKNTPVYLIGDSNADHFSEAVIAAATEADRPVKIITKGGCSFIGRSWSDASASAQSECLAFVDATRHFLAGAPHGQVILGLSDSLWNYVVPVGPSPDVRYTTRAGVQKYLQGELLGLIKELQSEGHAVVLLQPVPKFIAKDHTLLFETTKCSTIDVLLRRCPRRVTVSTNYERDLQHYARIAMSQAAEETRSPLLDFYGYLCPQGKCSNVSATGQILYRDAGHLTVAASRMLSAAFLPVLAPPVRTN